MQTLNVPGARSLELTGVKERYVPRGVFNVAPVFMQSATGASIVDVDGNTFIDFAGGLGVLNVGHCHPRVTEALKAQVDRFLHGCFHVTMYESYVDLAKTLAEITPGGFPKKTMLSNSGAEAVENAVKIARAATGRKGIVVFESAFHGRTYLAMTMTSKVRPYKYGFGALAPEVYRIPFPYCYRCPAGEEKGNCSLGCIELFKTFFAAHADPGEIAAVVIEPVTGEGGFIPAPPAYLAALRRICTDNGILLVADEVQTGFGRTGKLFACEHSALEPDIMTMAKSMAAGLPLSAVTGRAEVMDAPMVGGLGGTFGGNPLSCTAALEVVAILREEGFLERATAHGEALAQRLSAMKERYPLIGDVRGLGPMAAIELVTDAVKKTPAKEATARIVKECCARGLIILKAGVLDNVIRMLMPLIISDEDRERGLDILEEALSVAGREGR